MLGALCLFTCLANAAQDDEAKRPPVLKRVYVAGASVSDGFGLSKDLKTSIKLSHVFQASCKAVESEFLPLGDARFFLDPRGAGERIIKTAKDGEATCFVGVDFLFWYAYGMKSEKLRVSYVDAALKALEELDCPVLLGDLPDMSIALEGNYFGRPMITPEMIPTKETLKTINEHLHAWTAERKDAHVVPLASLLKKIQSGKDIQLREVLYQPENLKELMQADLLHLTAEGSMAVCLLVGDLLVNQYEEVSVEDFVFDREDSMDRLMTFAKEKREAELLEREARRAERRREREERRKKKDEEEEEEAPRELRAAS
jgi:hypothetical protein